MNGSTLRRFSSLNRCLRVALILSLFWFVGCGDDEVIDTEQNQNQEQNQGDGDAENQEDPDFYSVGGTVAGLEMAGLTLQNNGGDDLQVDADGAFVFSAELEDGEAYEVTVAESPEHHECTVENGSGVVDGADVTDVDVQCEMAEVDAPFYTVTIDADASTLEVEEGDSIEVVAEVRNVGNEFGNQNVSLAIDGEPSGSQGVQLGAGAFRAVTFVWDTEDVEVGTYTAEVISPDDSDSITVTVIERDRSANFVVEIDEEESTFDAVAGEMITVVALVENTGEESGTRDISLEIDGVVEVTSADLSLDGGESETVTLEWVTTTDDIGAYSGFVTTGDDEAAVSGTVFGPTHFSVVIDEAASNLDVLVGEMVEVVATVENTGDIEGTQDIVLEINGEVQDTSADLELAGGASQTVTLQWQTDASDAGSFTAEVASDDDTDDITGTVSNPAHLVVTINEGASTLDVVAGQTVVLVADVENTGDLTGTEDIVLEIGGVVRDTEADFEVAAGATETVTLEWQTGPGDGGAFVAEVSGDETSDTANGNVSLPANFTVAINEGASTLDVDEEETIIVVAEIENTGDLTATQDIALEIGGVVRDTHANLELAAGASQTVTLQWTTEVGDSDFYTATVSSDDDSDTAAVRVRDFEPDPAFFRVSINEAASTLDVDEGQMVEVVATIENQGDEAGTQDVVLEIDGVVQDTEADLTLGSGDSETLTFQWQTAAGDGGPFTAEVKSENESRSVSGYVNLPAFFAVSINDAGSSLDVMEGETVSVVVVVENTGDLTSTQDISLEIDGIEEDLQSLELSGGASASITLEWVTGDPGGYTAEVSSDDDSDSRSVTVTEIPPTNLSGIVTDATGQTEMEGVEVLLLDGGTDLVVESTFVGAGGAYEFSGLTPGDYDLLLQAPGLEPNYEVDEIGGDTLVSLTLEPGDTTQDLTVDWIRETTLYVDGGFFDFRFSDPDDELIVEFPNCEQVNGSWEPQEIETSDNMELTFAPDDECFQFRDMGVDLLTGVLDVGVGDILFPDITLYIDDSDDEINAYVDSAEVDFEWIFDGVSGQVDFTTGTLELDFDTRILVGGTVVTSLGNYNFGARDNEFDCQLTRAWGGDVNNPQLDTNGVQIGDYLHDPIQFRLTTGDSGSTPVTGQGYDSGVGYFIAVDNAFEMGRLSEGQYGRDDDGGASCGDLRINLVFEVIEVDFADVLNDLLDLPAGSGDMLLEQNLVIPLD